ncbi:winged helix DNA-binding protein [Paenibacillus sp. LPE1-1-1.1]|uniref:winged helix DNA-binding protein n=1 Tax=Paenibacillus sp. LPE1-1-1.1 TaxID=3135230 RepID=UPI003413172C
MTHSLDPQVNAADSLEKQLLIKEMMYQVANVQKRFQSEGEDDERGWMIAKAKDPILVEFLKESTVIMLHVIDAIGELEPVNGITISKQFGIPRGSVSKITRRLVEQKMVQSEFLEGNKKEVLFQLTPLGHQVFELHKRLHVHIEHNVRNFLRRYDVEQMRFLVQCMKDTSEASWVQEESLDNMAAKAHGNAVEPTVSERLSQEALTISEIVSKLQQLDARNLKKAKDLIQVAFFD